MNMSELTIKISEAEGLKKQSNIAQIKEQLRVTAILVSQDEGTLKKFLQYGIKSAKAKLK